MHSLQDLRKSLQECGYSPSWVETSYEQLAPMRTSMDQSVQHYSDYFEAANTQLIYGWGEHMCIKPRYPNRYFSNLTNILHQNRAYKF
jgi:hypothetical protein